MKIRISAAQNTFTHPVCQTDAEVEERWRGSVIYLGQRLPDL